MDAHYNTQYKCVNGDDRFAVTGKFDCCDQMFVLALLTPLETNIFKTFSTFLREETAFYVFQLIGISFVMHHVPDEGSAEFLFWNIASRLTAFFVQFQTQFVT